MGALPPSPRAEPAESSRQRYLDAADRLFIRHGYDRCTIRVISAEAKTSLALLSRQWSGKKALFTDVFSRHFEPIHRAQGLRFDAIEAEGRYDLQDIIEAFYSPALRGNIGSQAQRISHQVYSRALMDPSDEARDIARTLVKDTRARLITLLRRALPDLDDTAFYLAVATILGSYVYPQINAGRLAEVMGIDFDRIDWPQAARSIAAYLAHGILAQDVGNRPTGSPE